MDLRNKKISDTFDNLLCIGDGNDNKITLGNGEPIPWEENKIVVTDNITQTIQGDKRFLGPLTLPATLTFKSNGSFKKNGNDSFDLNTLDNTTISFLNDDPRIYTIPNTNVDASFIMSEANQTINGIKTFNGAIRTYGDTEIGLTGTATNLFGTGAKNNRFGDQTTGYNTFGNNVTGFSAYNSFGAVSKFNYFGEGATYNRFGESATGFNRFGNLVSGATAHNEFGGDLKSGAENRFGRNSQNHFGEDGENYFYSGYFEGPVTLPSTVSYIGAGQITKGGNHPLRLNTTAGTTGAFPTGNITIAALEGTQTFAGEKTFTSGINILKTTNQLVLGTTNKTTISATTPSAARTYTIPDVGGNASFIMTTGIQVFNSRMRFENGLVIQKTADHIDLRTGDVGTNTINISAPTITASRTYTIPDVGGNASFVMTTGSQTIGGVKNFTTRPTISGLNVLVAGEGTASLSYGLKFGKGLTPFNRTFKGDQLVTLSVDENTTLTVDKDQKITSVKTFTTGQIIEAKSNQLTLRTGNAGSSITITAPTINADRIYTIPDVGSNGSFVMTNAAQTIDGQKTFSAAPVLRRANDQLVFRTGTAGSTMTISAPTIAANRVYTLPDVGGNASFIMSTGVQTFSSPSVFADGLFVQKRGGYQLAFKTGSNANFISIHVPTINASRDYTLPDVGGNADFVMSVGTQTVNGTKTFTATPVFQTTSNQLNLRTGSAGSSITISAPTIAANRTYTIPDAGENTNFMMLGGAQTVNGIKTFTTAPVFQTTSNQLTLRTGSAGSSITITAPTIAANRTYTIPDVATAAQFVMTAGSQTISGVKTFSDAPALIAAVPTNSSSAGTSGQIAFNGTHIFRHDGTQWRRAPLTYSTF